MILFSAHLIVLSGEVFLHIYRYVLLKYFLAIINICSASQPRPQAVREKKLLNVFEVVKFPNDPCSTSTASSSNTTGYALFYVFIPDLKNLQELRKVW